MIICLIAISAVFVLTRVVFGIGLVTGSSMTPALKDGDIVIFYRLCGEYERGDIVLIKTSNIREDYIKRICALPGETAGCNPEGEFKVDMQALDEPYIYGEKTYSKNGGSYIVMLGSKQYFVMGDHRTNSTDSRDYGAVDAHDIAGKVLITIRLN